MYCVPPTLSAVQGLYPLPDVSIVYDWSLEDASSEITWTSIRGEPHLPSPRQDIHGYHRFSGFQTLPNSYRFTGRHTLPRKLPLAVPTAEKVIPSLERSDTGSEADRGVLCHLYLWMYNQETRHISSFRGASTVTCPSRFSLGVVFGPHGPTPLFTFVEIPPTPQFRVQHSLARLVLPPDIQSLGSSYLPTIMFTEYRVTNNGRSSGIPTGDAAPKRGRLPFPGRRQPSVHNRRRGHLAASHLPSPASRLPPRVLHHAVSGKYCRQDSDPERLPKASCIDQELPHWADYMKHSSVRRPSSLPVSSYQAADNAPSSPKRRGGRSTNPPSPFCETKVSRFGYCATNE